MSEFVAGAFVDVKPDTKGFREDLKKKVNASIKSAGTFKVPIQFEIKAFKKQLQDAARQAKPVIPIAVGGNVEQLRKDINDKIRRATAGMTIKVPVEVTEGRGAGTGGTGGGTGGGGRGGGSGLTQKEKELTQAKKLRAQAEKALIDLDSRAAIVEKQLAAATEGGLSVEERAQRLREARTSANAAVRVSTDALARTEAVLTEAQRAQLVTANEQALATRALVIEKQKALAMDTAAASATTKSAEARAAAVTAMAVEVTEVTSLNDLHVIENELLAAEASLKRATNKARELGLTDLAEENALLLTNIAERKELIKTQRAELKGEGKRITQQKTLGRGAVSTALSFLGLRGATLAASGAFLGGAAAAAVFSKSLQAFAAFEAELNTFQAVAGATAAQMTQVSRVAEQLGADITLPAVSAADAATAMTELARAGLDVQNSITGARGVLELAAAAQISNADAATLVASGLNAFSLSGEEAVHVADLLANAANAAQGSIAEMGAAMQQAAAIAHQVGITLDDTVAILTLFARNGLRGSDAGTSLRTALARLIAPTAKAAAVIDELGLNVRDANGNVRPEIFADFAEATKNLTPALRDMLAETIAGQDSIRAFAIGGREGARGLELARLQMAQTGTAAQVAAARTKGLAGQFSALASNAETLGIKLGEIASGPATSATTVLNELFSILNKFGEGDFFGGFKEIGQFGFNQAKDDANGLKLILEGFTDPSIEGGFNKISKGVRKLFSVSAGEQSKVQTLLERLDSLQKIRIQAFQAKLDIGPITEDIKRVRAQLREEKIDAGLIIPVTDLEKALAPLREARRAAKEMREELKGSEGADKPEVVAQIENLDKIIAQSTVKIRAKIKNFKKESEDEISGLDLATSFNAQFALISKNIEFATPEVLGSIDDLIADIKKVPVGTAPQSLGLKIAKSIQIAINSAIDEDDPELAAALKKKALAIAALFGGEAAAALKNLKIPVSGEDIANAILPFEIRALRAEAGGDIAGQIAAKKAQLAELNRQLKGVREGTQEEADIWADIVSVQGEIEDLITGQASESDARISDAISAGEQRAKNKVAIAGTTETLNDDIRALKELRAFYVKQIQIAAASIKDKKERNSVIADLKQKLFDLDLDISEKVRARADKIFDDAAERASQTETLADDLRVAERRVRYWKNQVKIIRGLVRERKATAAQLRAAQDALDAAEDEAQAARKSRRQQRRENRQERLELRIQIAQDNGNLKAEIRAREAQIKFTQERIRMTRKGSLARLRLIAELRREQRELRELKKEKEKSAKEAKSVIFAFMQAQQGFAANLLSNLVPFNLANNTLGVGTTTTGPGLSPVTPSTSTSTSFPGAILPQEHGRGRVPPTPSEALAREATVQAATKPQQGFTNSQATRLINLTAQMVSLLGGQVNRGSHPHSKTQAKRSGGSADVE